MQAPRADAYVFDIDGTLLVTRDLVHWNALHQAMLEVYGVDTTIEGIPYHGKTDLSILRAALARAGVDDGRFRTGLERALVVIRRDVEAGHDAIIPMVCPGIPRFLESIQKAGKLIGVASGNLEAVGWRKIEAAGLKQFFSFGFFSDGCESRAGIFRNALTYIADKLGPWARTCFVGDTPFDIEAAREVGAAIVAVASGTFTFDELTACSPDLCLSDCGQLFRD
ncbi:MAG: HAD family hydrolase [Acidobacteria bacterium]|nr:HAD family hydrolase [Acidobacteriota bacterium]